MNVTTKGIESSSNGFRIFVERHDPCVALHGTDHTKCTVKQRFVSDAVWATADEAIAASESVEVDGNSRFERAGDA